MAVDLFKAVPDPLIGRKLDGRYEVLGRLGEGGVGVVYRGKQSQLGRFVAIKVLHQDAAAIPEWRQRFQREARALSVLSHPNVVTVTDSGIDRGVPYLVMELLQGKTLGELLKEGTLPLWRALDIIRQLLRGLAFAHSKGIVHRDLKPANVFLQALPDQADHVRLLDFGMAKFLEGGGSSRTMTENLTHAGVVFGTPAYMSPEQIKSAPVDARTDVYAVGVLLFELLAGRRPFHADSYEGYMGAHLTQPVPSLAKVHPNLAAAPLFQQVVEKAMAKKPGARYKDAAAFLTALEAVIAKLPPAATSDGRAARRKSAPHAKVRSTVRSRFLPRAILVVMGAGGIAAAGTYLVRDWVRPAEIAALPPAPPKKALPAKSAPKPVLPSPPPEPVAPAPPPTPAPTPALPSEPAPTVAVSPPPAPPTAPAQPPPKPVVLSPKPAEAPEPAEIARASGSDARNPWHDPVPRVLKPIRDRIERGGKVSQRALKPVYAYAHDNPDDPRPWLLLGHVYGELDWYSDSIDRYTKALRIDSSTRGDPHMLPDLIKAAVHPVAGRAGARAIRDIYGAEAIPALDKAIERRASDKDATARLAKLRESLSR